VCVSGGGTCSSKWQYITLEKEGKNESGETGKRGQIEKRGRGLQVNKQSGEVLRPPTGCVCVCLSYPAGSHLPRNESAPLRGPDLPSFEGLCVCVRVCGCMSVCACMCA